MDGYKKHKTSAKVPAPMTTREEELQEIKRAEVTTDYSVDSRHQTLGGVGFPITNSAKDALEDMARGSYDYLRFRIGIILEKNSSFVILLFINLDIDEETIHLDTAENTSLEKLPSKVPEDTARYHLYKFKHTHEGDYTESIGIILQYTSFFLLLNNYCFSFYLFNAWIQLFD